MRRTSSTQAFFLLAALALVGSASCSKSTDGTYVKLVFTGSVDQPIRKIVLNLTFASGSTTSTTFQKPNGDITLPATAALDIRHGEGLLTVGATAIAADGVTVLGTGVGANTVVRDETVEIHVVLARPVPDAGVDAAPGIDGPRPGVDLPARETPSERPIDGAVAPDAPLDTAGPDAGTDVPGPGIDVGTDTPFVGGTGGSSGTGGKNLGGAGGSIGLGGIVGRGGSPGTGGTTRPDAGPGSYLLIATPTSADFGIIVPGSVSAAKSFLITNKGDAPAPNLTLAISDPKSFPVTQNDCAGLTLPPGGACKVTFTFTPQVTGQVQAEASISPPGAPGAKFQLAGTGAGGPATLSLSPTNVQLPPMDVNTSAPVNFVLTNGGDSEAGSINIQVPADPPGFQLTANGCGAGSLGPRSQCAFTVTFTAVKLGPVTTTVSVQSSLGLSASASITGTGRRVVNLTIGFTGTGKGTVTVSGAPQGTLTCPSGAPCTFSFTVIDVVPQVTLSAAPNANTTFDGWTGDCTGATCALTMDTPHQVTAGFTQQMATLNLTLLGLAGRTGTIASPDGSAKCTLPSGSSSVSCLGISLPVTSAFTLNAEPAGNFAAWTSGPCKGTSPQCPPFTLTGTVNIVATFGPQSYMFVSSTTVIPGKLEGLAGADAVCMNLARNAKLPGTKYLAWLSSSSETAFKRVGPGGWIRTDGRPFARDQKSLADPTLLTVFYPPRLTEQGTDLGNMRIPVATGSGPDGYGIPGTNGYCRDYTTGEGSLSAGDASSGSSVWTRNVEDDTGCAKEQRLYCFRADLNPGPIDPAPQKGRRVFVTSQPYLLGGSATPDELCGKEADAANMDPAAFVAFLATTETPAMKLVNLTGMPWKRLDGVFIVNQPADLGDMKLLAPIDALADGVHYTPSSRVWTGATEPKAQGTATCGDWRGVSGTIPAIVGDNSTSTTPDWFSFATRVTCRSETTRLMCIERVDPK